MPWSIVNRFTQQKLETHNTIRAAQRACMIVNAHELKNGRQSDTFVIEPKIVEACPPSLEELNLPDWAMQALMKVGGS